MAKNLFVKGWVIDIPAGQNTGTVEASFAYETELHGIMIFCTSDVVVGDKGNLEIVHPVDGVVGNYAEDAYLAPIGGTLDVSVRSVDDPAILPAGLIYRFTYNAVDLLGRKCVVWLRLKR